jgi:hypothetical protein
MFNIAHPGSQLCNLVCAEEMRRFGFGLVGGPVPSRKLVDHMNHPMQRRRRGTGAHH